VNAERDLERTRALVAAALASLEASRARIDDLNVYPVPDGDTGTNLVLTVRAVADAVARAEPTGRAPLAQEVARAALMGARGASGVILSQIVRGAARVLAESTDGVDPLLAARALRGAADAAYRAVRRPVEGTMLSVVGELAEEAERRAAEPAELSSLLAGLVRRGEEAVARTPEQLAVLREAGVVDAGGAGLVELLRGVAAAVAGTPARPPAPVEAAPVEPARVRYCTVFVVEGEGLERDELEARLEPLGDALRVVGDPSALKVHVHTDDPGAALSVGVAAGTICEVEVADLRTRAAGRARRPRTAAGPAPVAPRSVPRLSLVRPRPARSGVVVVAAGEGNRRLVERLAGPQGPVRVVEGDAVPSPGDLLAAIRQLDADEALLLPNDCAVRPAAERAAQEAAAGEGRAVELVPSESLPAGLAALAAYDGARSAAANARAMTEAAAAVAAGEVVRATSPLELAGRRVQPGEWLGLAGGEPVSAGSDPGGVALEVVERLLEEPRRALTVLIGAHAPPLAGVLERIAAAHPELEVAVHEGGQPRHPLLLGAE